MFWNYIKPTLKCRNCLKTLAELELAGEKQNRCPFCNSIDSCEPIKELSDGEIK